MRLNLKELEIRVLGSLMEKELTTPEQYPLSLNALVSACNQKSNRDPVMTVTEEDVVGALYSLGGRGLARLTTTGGRVARYCHSVTGKLGLGTPPRAILAELMLRGPQTPGELRSRADRMADFADLAAVEATLFELQQCAPPLVIKLPRQPGRKEQRYAQLMGGAPEISELPDLPEEEEAVEERRQVPRPAPQSSVSRLVRLEGEVATVREEIASLRREIEEVVSALS